MACKLIDVEQRGHINFESVEYFVCLFSHLLALREPKNMELLQVISCEVPRNDDIPAEIWEHSKIKQDKE